MTENFTEMKLGEWLAIQNPEWRKYADTIEENTGVEEVGDFEYFEIV